MSWASGSGEDSLTGGKSMSRGDTKSTRLMYPEERAGRSAAHPVVWVNSGPKIPDDRPTTGVTDAAKTVGSGRLRTEASMGAHGAGAHADPVRDHVGTNEVCVGTVVETVDGLPRLERVVPGATTYAPDVLLSAGS
jgi:hypothetical protein